MHNPRAAVIVCVVVLAALPYSALPVSAARNGTHTRTVPLPPGTMALDRTEYSLVSFRSRYVFPNTAMTVTLANNSFLSAKSASCLTILRESFVTPAEDGAPWDPALIDSISFPEPTRMVVAIRGFASFYLEGKKKYRAEIPASCLQSVSSPPAIDFTIENGKRSALGRVFTFMHLTAACFGALALLGGSMSAIAPVQLAAVLTSSGCGPIDFQEEFDVLRWTLVPFHLPTHERSRDGDFNMLASIYVLLASLLLLEALHFACVTLTGKGYKDHMVAAFAMDKSKYGIETRDKDGGRWERRGPLPPYVLICLLLGQVPGIVRFGIRTILQSDGNAMLLCAFLGVGFSFIVFPLVIVGLSRNKAMGYVSYHSSRLPRWLQPSGVWGSNVLRLTCGPLYEDFRRGRRAIGAGHVLFHGVVAALAGSNPRAEDACRNAEWVVAFLAVAYVGYLYIFRPFRAKFFNHGHIISYALFAAFAAMYLARSGYYYRAPSTHWSSTALFTVGILHASAAAVMAFGHVVVVGWEAMGGRAFRHVNGDVAARSHTIRNDVKPMESELTELDPSSPSSPASHGAGSRHSSPQHGEGTAAAALYDPRGQQSKFGPAAVTASEMYEDMLTHFAKHPVDEMNREAVTDQSAVAGPKSLAEYLLEDYDALPPTTRDEMILWERLSRSKKRQDGSGPARAGGGGGLEPMVVHPEALGDTRNLRVQSRVRPPVTVDFL
jgi:hypothetical protein